MKTQQRKKLLIAVVAIALLILLALLNQRGLFPFKKYIAGQVGEQGNEIRVTTPDEVFAADGNPLVNGDCSLFEAFYAADENVAVDACPPGLADAPDIIILQENATYRTQAVGIGRRATSAFSATGGTTVVEGNGSIIEGGGAQREFRMIYGNSVRLTLKNLTIRNFQVSGDGQQGRGGALYLNSGALNIDNCTFVNNSAKWGGALFTDQILLRNILTATTITNSTFTGNSASFGGGALYFIGTAELHSSTVSNNVSSGSGGGIYLRGARPVRDVPPNEQHSSRLVIEDSFITSNSARGGGGIFNVGEAREIDAPQIINYLATTLVVNRSSVNNNTGGGIANGGHAVINNSSIIGNRSGGGGIGWHTYAPAGGTSSLFLRNSTVAKNQGVQKGGGLHASVVTKIDHSTIVENVSSEDNADGIFIAGTTPQLRNTILAGNGDSDCLAGLGHLISFGNNLFGIMANCGLDQDRANPNDQTGIEIGLGPLIGAEDSIPGNEHYPPGPSSPAVNAGNPEFCVDDPDANGPQLGADQLGRERTGLCDIGAAEAVCGDGIAHAVNEEECDDGNDVNTDACLNDCTEARCGDGIVQAGVETCDDANEDDADGCQGNCRSPECGDGAVQAERGEACDDGNRNNGDACLNSCLTASCGDGLVQNGVEACDDGNLINDDACGNNCVAGRCGDSVKQENEECDDGNQVADDPCTNECKIFVAEAPPPPDGPVNEEEADIAQADPGFDEEAGVLDSIEPTDTGGQIVSPPSGGTTGNQPSPSSSESDDEEEEGSGGGGCSLTKMNEKARLQQVNSLLTNSVDHRLLRNAQIQGARKPARRRTYDGTLTKRVQRATQ